MTTKILWGSPTRHWVPSLELTFSICSLLLPLSWPPHWSSTPPFAIGYPVPISWSEWVPPSAVSTHRSILRSSAFNLLSAWISYSRYQSYQKISNAASSALTPAFQIKTSSQSLSFSIDNIRSNSFKIPRDCEVFPKAYWFYLYSLQLLLSLRL